jgi:hypothetical protein
MMKSKVYVLAMSITVTITIAVVQGQQAEPSPAAESTAAETKRFHGVFDGRFMNRAIESIAIFLDSSRTNFPSALKRTFDADNFIVSVSTEADALKLVDNLQSMTVGPTFFQNIPDVPEPYKALFVMLLPRDPTGADVNGKSCQLRRFVPGKLTNLRQLQDAFGDCSETESWQGYEKFGVKGMMHWWGNVGVVVADDGSVTHLAIRKAPQS